jgi:hypothetical protein
MILPGKPSTPSGRAAFQDQKATDHELQKHDKFTRSGHATATVIHGNSLSLETWGGFYVRRSPFGGEQHRLTKDDTDRINRLPFAAPPETTTTAVTPAPVSVLREPTPEAKAVVDELASAFTVNKRGQGDFGS